MKILIAEDDAAIANSLRKNFADENIESEITSDGNATLTIFEKEKFDALLLDWRMPQKSGLEVCKILRKKGFNIPIILLTAVTDVKSKVEALNIGADDYITKPFSFDEVLARINAVIRRKSPINIEIIFGKMRLNLVEHKLFVENTEVKLTEKEFDLLKYFIENKGMILNRENICQNVWNYNFTPETNIVESTIKNLRKKIELNCDKKLIKNIYGEGYILLEE
ncbi:MAG: DNA-binding response regulator [Ignavibacteriae bacterium HGW-Ignavibacteriae-2]|jgi:DNA-binding response OmpR family regulator|nr:MAG: DNA-binding response regulator [Ignavibacteriae bacterium HGW-Ignavibacteriae-2]